MTAETVRYIFWVILSLPVIAAGVWFCARLLSENKVINKELDDIKMQEDPESGKRQKPGRSYGKKRSGDR